MERKKALKDQNSAEIRIRELQTSKLINRFKNVVQHFQKVQSENKERYKQRAKRQYKIAFPNANDEELEQKIKEADVKVFQQAMISSAQKHTLNAVYEEVKETHRELVMLEQSMMELHEMFVQFHALLESQDDLIDNIEHMVQNTNHHVIQGNKSLKKAQSYQRKECNVM